MYYLLDFEVIKLRGTIPRYYYSLMYIVGFVTIHKYIYQIWNTQNIALFQTQVGGYLLKQGGIRPSKIKIYLTKNI